MLFLTNRSGGDGLFLTPGFPTSCKAPPLRQQAHASFFHAAIPNAKAIGAVRFPAQAKIARALLFDWHSDRAAVLLVPATFEGDQELHGTFSGSKNDLFWLCMVPRVPQRRQDVRCIFMCPISPHSLPPDAKHRRLIYPTRRSKPFGSVEVLTFGSAFLAGASVQIPGPLSS